MYFDEDGDLAHEFYEEILPKKRGGLRRMRKINCKRLIPQGEVQYPNPRLHVDFPIILFEGWTAWTKKQQQKKIPTFCVSILFILLLKQFQQQQFTVTVKKLVIWNPAN